MTRKAIYFYYNRDSLPHSEFAVTKSLDKFLSQIELLENDLDLEESSEMYYSINTSTAAIFNIVRAFCLKNKIYLVAQYEDISLTLCKNMRMEDWYRCPDFNITENASEVLLTETKK